MKVKKSHIILSLLIFIVSFSITGINHRSFSPQYRIETPKLSAGEIAIITPENKTYTEPNYGYYPATYGFENELHGTIGLDLEFLDEYYGHAPSAYTDIKVIDGPVDGHNKFLSVTDSQAGTNTWGVHHFDNPPSSGTVEFYLWHNHPTTVGSSTKRQFMEFRASDNTIAFRMMVELMNDRISYYDGANWQQIASTIPEIWFHHSVTFDCEAGVNGQFTWIMSDEQGNEIDRVENIEFENDLSIIDELYIGTHVSDYRGHTNWDAFGFSWDPYYNVGDNIDEGLLIGFETDETLDWMGYSFDGQNNVTILGNKTISMPNDGHHRIQIFGNDSLSIMHQSDLRYFTVGSSTGDIEEWQYFRQISLNPSTPEPDYQVKVQLDTLNFDYSKTNPDGSDIRFFDQNLNSLSYWIEKWNITGISIIWVKIPSSGTTFFYMYYGNPFASSQSNGTATFIVFDDFEGTSLDSNKWYTDVDVPGAYEIADAHVAVSNSIAEVYLLLDPDTWGGSYTPEMRWEDSTLGWNDYWANGGGYGYFTPNGFTFFEDDTRTETETAEEVNNDVGGAEWTWLVDEIQWINSSLVKFYEDDVLLSEHTNSASFPTEGTLPIKFLVHGGSYPNGDHYLMSLVSNNNYNEIGYSLRTLARREWNENAPSDLSLTMHIDWILIHKCNEFEPIISVGPETDNKYPPIISIISPTDNDVIGNNAPDFEISIFGADINYTWYTIDNGVINITFTGLVGTIDQTEWEKKGDETVFLRFYVNNTWGNESYAEVLLRKDITKPVIIVDSPLDNELFGKPAPNFNLTIIEDNIHLRWYTLDNGLTNITFAGFSGTIDQSEWNKKGNGTVTIRFYILDKAGNIASDEVTVRKEVSDPIVIINDPVENELFGTIAPPYNISVIEPDFDSMWYTLDDGITNITIFEFNGDISQTEWNKKFSGMITIKFYANDTLGNIGYAEVVLEKDVTPPLIQINTPNDNDIIGYTAPNYVISITEPNLDEIWLSLDNGITQIPLFSFTGTIDQTEWNKKGSGSVSIRFYANDSMGNEDYNEVIVVKDLIDPQVTIISPDENEVFGNNPPTFEISIVELNLDIMWYTLDNGITNIPLFSFTGTIDQTEWNKKNTGNVTIQFFVSDKAGNEGSTEVIIMKDIDMPIVTINSPKMDDFANPKAPSFNISVQEPHIDLMWYSLDYGMNNYYFTEFTGTINQGEWDKYGNEVVVIRFYVRDESGNMAFSEVSINKDIYVPIITINTPELGTDIVDYPPIYSITIEEANLDKYWYTIDEGVTNHTISELTGIIDEDVWNSAPDGPLTIRFYAKDKGGNIGSNEVIVIKRTTKQKSQEIPGYNLFLLIGMISIISTVLIKRKLKS